MVYLGIDPGVAGGLAIISALDGVTDAVTMPATDRDLLEQLENWADVEPITFALLERVNAGLFHGKAGKMGVSSAFTFGRGYGRLEMALAAMRIPFDYVMPARWQQALGCLSRGDKNVTKRRAQQLFPRVKITHAIADALLIAEFCRRSRGSHGTKEGTGAQGSTQARRQSKRQGIIRARVDKINQALEQLQPIDLVPSGPTFAISAGDGAGPQREARSSVRVDRRAARDREPGAPGREERPKRGRSGYAAR